MSAVVTEPLATWESNITHVKQTIIIYKHNMPINRIQFKIYKNQHIKHKVLLSAGLTDCEVIQKYFCVIGARHNWLLKE